VHLQQLRGGAVDPREVVQQLVVGPVAAVPPEAVAADVLRRREREEPGGAQLREVLLRERRGLVERAGPRAEAVGERVDPAQPLGVLGAGQGVDGRQSSLA
jgi:hypothetical protein